MLSKPLLILSLLVFLKQSPAQGILKVHGKMIVNGKGEEMILRGIGLGGWMLQEPYMLQLSGIAVNQTSIRARIVDLIGEEATSKFYNAWLKNQCRKADIDSLAAWGFNSVRLPMHYNLFTPAAEQEPVQGKNTWLTKGFQLIDSLLGWCRANKIYLILDLHAAPGGQGNDIAISDRDTSKPSLWQSEINKEKTIALWRKLAERYANEQWIGGYDLINEPNWGFQNASDRNGCAETDNGPLKKMLTDITAAIREVDKNHIIFIEANCWANNYNGIFPLWDKNMVVSFHKYWNYNNPGSIQNYLDIRDRYNVPIWCGESGENSNVWFTGAIELLERNKIGWAWWPLKKIGSNNPLQVKVNEGYKKLLSYWHGQSPKPPQAEAYRALMELTEDVKTENNLVHKDVIDAMFRQVASTKTIPFKENVIKSNSIVFATDYDLGRNGFAYLDNDSANYHVSTGKRTPGNRGGQYRNDGVDIEPCTDSLTNGFNLGWMEQGEWLQYTVTVVNSGVYDINIRSASEKGAIQLIINDSVIKDNASLLKPATDKEWQNTLIKNIPMAEGINRFKIQVLKGGFKLNYFQFITTETNIHP